MKTVLTIISDHNDGDYVTEETDITEIDIDELEEIRRFAKAANAIGYHNWDTNTRLYNPEKFSAMYPGFSEDFLDWVAENTATDSEGFCHTICSMEIREIRILEKLI